MTALIILYSIALVIVFSGTLFLLKYAKGKPNKLNVNTDLEFAIIVAFKNEEHNLPRLVKSIKNLDYPIDNYEIIFIDDNSTDNSNRFISEYAAKHGNIKLISAVDKKLPAKKGALTIGINASRFENILITDADCILQSKWLQICSKYFSSDGKIFFGEAPFIQEESFANKLACFENVRSQLLTFAFANAGLPYSAAARNFGFKKSAWQELNGYENTTETISGDDDLLIREAVKKGYKIVTIFDKEAAVYSATPKTLGDYIKQKSRHLSTSHYYLFRHQLFLGLWHLSNILLLTPVLTLFISQWFIIPFFLKLYLDAFLITKFKKDLNYNFEKKDIGLLQLSYELILIIGFVLSIFNKKNW